jgi:hypothetical protein
MVGLTTVTFMATDPAFVGMPHLPVSVNVRDMLAARAGPP